MMTVWATFKMCNFEPSQSGGPHLESPLPATAAESLIQSIPELPTGGPVQAQGACCGLSPPSSTQGPILWGSTRIAAQPDQDRTSASETMSQAKLLAFMRTRSGYCSPRQALTPCFLIKIEAVVEYSRKLLHLGNCRLSACLSPDVRGFFSFRCF